MELTQQELHAVETVESELVDDSATFFAPVSSDLLDTLLGRYQEMRRRVEAMGTLINADHQAVACFVDGNCESGRWSAPSVDKMFAIDGAVGSLNSRFWAEAMSLTDVYDCMPQKRREEWQTAIREQTTPEFTEDAVRATFTDLLNSRSLFLAERVDGIFRGLSGEHVTNAPEAFGKRMILARALNEYHHPESRTCGLINDLRCVIAKFMGRDEPGWDASSSLLYSARGDWGEWRWVDGGAFRMRVYMKGTAHIEIHPDMAWRLNSILANLYPLAIPAQFRQKPKKKPKEFVMLGRPLPFAVLQLLSNAKEACEYYKDGWRDRTRPIPMTRQIAHDAPKAAKQEAEKVYQAIGGVPDGNFWRFDYEPGRVLAEVITSGCIPDQRAHQFYPTPERLALLAVEAAEIGDAHTVLEPSAGQGGIADHLPKDRTQCVEVSDLHCLILAGKQHRVHHGDFLAWITAMRFDRIVMNPPFSEGRWLAHTQRAAELLNPGGRLVAILPASARGKDLLPGMACTWSSVYENEFAGTSTAVVMLTATNQCEKS